MMRRLGKIAFVLLAIVASFQVATGEPGRSIEAVMVMADIATAGNVPWRALSSDAKRSEITWSVDGRRGAGDLYKPPGKAYGAVVLAPGAAQAGRRDPRLIAFAGSLTRAGFTVLVPDIVELRRLHLSPDNTEDLADAVMALAVREPDAPLGIIGVSYSVAPSLIAGARSDISSYLSFIVGLGGYYDSHAAIRYFTTGKFRGPGETEWRDQQPFEYGKWVFVRANAAQLQDKRDAWILTQIADRKLDDVQADIGDLFGRLGVEGRRIFDLAVNNDPDLVDSMLARLPLATRNEIDALDPSRHDLSGLKAHVLLVHGKDDPIIPWTESQALAKALPAGQAELYLVDAFGHVDFHEMTAENFLGMWHAVRALLNQRS